MAHITLSELMKQQFGKKVYKLSLDAGCTCPNRDGSAGYGGCIFCAEEAYATSADSIEKQIEEAKKKVAAKTKDDAYIAYFQSHTNTYGDVGRLERVFMEAINRPEIVALSIGTRPDCVDEQVLQMLKRLNEIKPVWVELGLQTIHEDTAKLINRGYELTVFEDCYQKLKALGITVIVHVIIGLPGESREDTEATVRYLAKLNPVLDGIKLQLMHVLRGTTLAAMYEENPEIIHEYSLEEYASFVAELVTLLPKETAIHRMTGDGPRKLLIYPQWTTDKKRVLNTINRELRLKERSENA